MCWTSKIYISPKVADKDIHVYKICLLKTGTCAIPYYNLRMVKYEPGKTYNADYLDVPLNDVGLYKIFHGIHSYSTNTILKPRMPFLLTVCFNNNVIGCYETIDLCMALCLIPKGSIYYLNEKGEYVSEYIKMKKFIPIQEVQHLSDFPTNVLNDELKKWSK